MSLLNIPLDQIDEQRLRALVTAATAESRTIDYKRETYGNSHSDCSELLADVSSFANTLGGDLVLGVAAKDGIPTEIMPLTASFDDETLRFEQIARDGLQPRIVNLGFRAVPISGGGYVLVVRIPRSYQGPHRVIRQRSNKFWARSAAGKYEPDVPELRSLFHAGPQIAARMRDFRLDRVAKIAARETPVQLMRPGAVVLHIIPFSAFDLLPSISLQDIKNDFRSFVPFGSTSANSARINFDGVLKTRNVDANPEHRTYVQLFRSGIVEAVNSGLVPQRTGTIPLMDDDLIFEVTRKLKDLSSIGVQPPYAVLVSLFDVMGARVYTSRHNHYDEAGERFDRDQYHFDEVILENQPASVPECAAALRPILDQMANAGDVAKSPVFDNQRNYIPRRA